MTQFIKSDFGYFGGYLTYGTDRKFVARFKYSGGPFTKAKFLKELIANHTVEDYFSALETKAPLAILRDENPNWWDRVMEAWKNK